MQSRELLIFSCQHNISPYIFYIVYKKETFVPTFQTDLSEQQIFVFVHKLIWSNYFLNM